MAAAGQPHKAGQFHLAADFLEGFPSVTRSQVIAFLEEAKDRVIESVS